MHIVDNVLHVTEYPVASSYSLDVLDSINELGGTIHALEDALFYRSISKDAESASMVLVSDLIDVDLKGHLVGYRADDGQWDTLTAPKFSFRINTLQVIAETTNRILRFEATEKVILVKL